MIRQEEEDSDHNDNIVKDKEEEVIYRKIDFVKTKAFNETRRQVENSRYNITQWGTVSSEQSLFIIITVVTTTTEKHKFLEILYQNSMYLK